MCARQETVCTAVAFSKDGMYLAFASESFRIKVQKTDYWAEEFELLNGHTGYVNCLAFSPNPKRLASSSEDCAFGV